MRQISTNEGSKRVVPRKEVPFGEVTCLPTRQTDHLVVNAAVTRSLTVAVAWKLH